MKNLFRLLVVFFVSLCFATCTEEDCVVRAPSLQNSTEIRKDLYRYNLSGDDISLMLKQMIEEAKKQPNGVYAKGNVAARSEFYGPIFKDVYDGGISVSRAGVEVCCSIVPPADVNKVVCLCVSGTPPPFRDLPAYLLRVKADNKYYIGVHTNLMFNIPDVPEYTIPYSGARGKGFRLSFLTSDTAGAACVFFLY